MTKNGEKNDDEKKVIPSEHFFWKVAAEIKRVWHHALMCEAVSPVAAEIAAPKVWLDGVLICSISIHWSVGNHDAEKLEQGLRMVSFKIKMTEHGEKP